MGQSLAASWRIGKIAPEVVIDGLEASVMWYTEGKGDEDLNVHHFRRWSDVQLKELDLTRSHGFQCSLPLTPLSYEGTLLRIRWCVRLRLFGSVGRDAVAQVPFQLISDAVPGLMMSRMAGATTATDRLDELSGSGSTAFGRS